MSSTEDLKKEYLKHKLIFLDFQKEIFLFLKQLEETHKSIIDIEKIEQRPGDDIKQLPSILKNFEERPEKYKSVDTIFDIKDIAGVRVTCHCSSDREILYGKLEGELKQKYENIIGDQKDGHYRAYHFNFSKNVKVEGQVRQVYCEIQLRTVLGNAWAIQDSKYIYKNIKGAGEPAILSKAISDILYSCESLWDLVKDKCREKSREITKEKFDFERFKTLKKAITESIEKQKKPSRNLKELTEWFEQKILKASTNFKLLGLKGYMEIQMYLPAVEINISKLNLLEAARKSTIRTFGWPIGIVLDRDEYRPKPTKDGVEAEISINKKDIVNVDVARISYDYWAIRQDGAYYLLKNLFEDERKPGYLFFNTRIVRITEVLMFARNLYRNLELSKNEIIKIKINHGGLKGRKMGYVGNRMIFEDRISIEDNVDTEIETTLLELENNLVDQVEKFTNPLFEIFDFFTINKSVLNDIVVRYVNGEVS